MQASTVALTGGASITIASLTPIVAWAINGFHGTPPDDLAPMLAAVILTGTHGLTVFVSNWLAKRQLVPAPAAQETENHG